MDNIPVKITYHKQRSSTARIRSGEIHLRISSLVSRREQKKHIDQLVENIMKKWGKHENKIRLSLRSLFPADPSVSSHMAETSPLLRGEYPPMWSSNLLLSTGVEYEVKVKKAQRLNYKIQKIGYTLIIQYPVGDLEFNAEKAEEMLWRFLKKDQISYLELRLNQLREGWLEEEFEVVKMKMVMTRWGSCDKRRGIIMLSAKLLLVEPKLLDYVCVHELAHLKHADHSDLFWDLVERKMPDWKVQRKRLKQYE